MKNEAKLSATPEIAHISRATSTTLPPVASGFVIADDMVSSCTAVKNTASP